MAERADLYWDTYTAEEQDLLRATGLTPTDLPASDEGPAARPLDAEAVAMRVLLRRLLLAAAGLGDGSVKFDAPLTVRLLGQMVALRRAHLAKVGESGQAEQVERAFANAGNLVLLEKRAGKVETEIEEEEAGT